MSIKTQITYKVKDSDGQSHRSISRYMSATRLCMPTDFAFKEGDEIELVINPSDDRLPSPVLQNNRYYE